MSVARTATAAMQVDDFAQAIEIIPGKFWFVWIRRPEGQKTSPIAAANISFSIDNELLYEPFFADFGPLNLGRAYRFCQRTNQLLQEAERLNKQLYYYTGPSAQHKANAAVLVGIYQVVFLGRTAEESFKHLLPYKPFLPFRDASCGVSTFHLTVFDCIKGMEKAKSVGFVDWHLPNSTFDIVEYEHYEQVENGDLNWIVPNKFVAFSGPAAKSIDYGGYRTPVPEDYWDYFRSRNVVAVVRLNKKVYDRRRFVDGGFNHHDLYFPDGSCPSDAMVKKFLEAADKEHQKGAIAVHCKAGLGRTGVMICCWLMKNYRFTAEEVIGWIRICRPGSVIGPQQHFLRDIQHRLWAEADQERAEKERPARAVSSPRGASTEYGHRGIGSPAIEPDTPGTPANRRAGSVLRHQAPQRPPPVLPELRMNGASPPPGPVGVSHVNPSASTSPRQAKAQDEQRIAGDRGGVQSAPTISGALTGSGADVGVLLPNDLIGGANGKQYGVQRGGPPANPTRRSSTPTRYAGPAPTSGYTRGAGTVLGRQTQGIGWNRAAAQGRSQSADRAPERGRLVVSEPVTPVMTSTAQAGSPVPFSSLRSTVDALPPGAFARPRVLPDRYAQSVPEPPQGGWRLSATPPTGNGVAGSKTPPQGYGNLQGSNGRAPSPGAQQQPVVTRGLAANGQPRKVPAQLGGFYSTLASPWTPIHK